ncbi:hypothetical protein [Salinigranum salinum]|uniref:hypothetical protein n=1 Tax=Salinigranum salinum TaxID=1364937 RepID=UPI0012605B6A|nr:hypothetical protein [Salinigranum salinum]
MNKLRAFVIGATATLVVASVWTAISYGVAPESTRGYLFAVGAAVVIPTVPVVTARGKRWVRQLAEYRRNGRGLSFERKSIFVSTESVDDSERVLADIQTAVDTADEYDDCRRDRFREGPGLTVNHTGFHNSFVRIGTEGRLVVTGASKKTHALADLVERAATVTMKRTRRHPFFRTTPVRGAPRSFMSVFLVVVFLVGIAGVGAAAYPAEVYSAPERAVLVGYDGRAAVVPGYDSTDATLDKAAFLVSALDEEAVELRWDRDSVNRLRTHTAQSVVLSETVTGLLDSARERELSASQRERAASVESDLHAAECQVAAAVTTRLEEGRVDGDPTPLERDRATLRDRAAAAGASCAG